jgi:hypothetical protein
MTRRSKLWRVGAALFILINLGGAGYAVALGEPAHAALHAVLLVLGYGAYLVWKRTPRARQQDLPQPDQRIEYLQQSVDAIALEVERIGEAQRFNDKIRVEPGEKSPPKKPSSEE